MKTLKILIGLLIFSGFASNGLNAQATEHVRNTWYDCWQLDCVGEMACGDITQEMVGNANTYIISFTGTLIGEETGTQYKFKHQYHGKSINNKGSVDSHSFVLIIHANGKPVAKCHYHVFITRNAKGEITVWKEDDYVIECL